MHVSHNVRVFLIQTYVTKLWVTKGKISFNEIKGTDKITCTVIKLPQTVTKK